MASINEILGKNIDSVKALKAEIKSLQDSLVGLDAESQEFKDTSLKLAAAQDELTKVTRAGKEENVAAADSIRGMEKEYKSLYDTYKMLSEEQRNSSFGQEMASQLETLSTKQGVGNFKDNIGRYASSVTEAFSKMGVSAGALQGPLKAATTGVKGFGTSLKALAANPIVLVITALVAILAKAAAAIKNNEELTNRLKEAMSVFKPILDGIANAFDFLAGILVKTVEGLTKVAEKVLSIIPGMKQAIESHKELAKATNELTKAQREANVENSKKEAEIERLREEASATDDVVEKKKLLEEAKAMQAEIDQKNIELAQEELRILEEYGEKTANSAEENEKLAAAQQKVNQAIAQGERNMRQYNKQLSQVEKSTKSAGSSAKNYREEAQKIYEATVEWNKVEIDKVTEKYSTEKRLLERYNMDTTLLTKKYEQDISKIRYDAIRQQLGDRSDMYERMARENTLMDELIENIGGRVVSLEKKIKDVGNNLPRNLQALQKQMDEVWESVDDTTKVILEDLFDEGVLSDATNFESRLERLTTGMQLAAKNFPEVAKEYEEAINKLKEIGPEGWATLTAEIQNTSQKIEKLFGITIGTGLEVQLQLEKIPFSVKELKKELEETFGDESAARISKFVTNSNLKLLKDAFSIDPSMFQDEDIPNYLNGGAKAFEEMLNFIREGEYKILEEQKTLYEQELANFSGTTEQKLAMLQDYYGVVAELRDRNAAAEELDARRIQDKWDAGYENQAAVKGAINSTIDTIKTYIQAQIDSGKITEKEAEKKKKTLKNLEKIQLAVTVAAIAADTAAGIMEVWRGYASELPVNAQTAAATGPAAAATKIALDSKSMASAILRSAAIGTEGTAQIAAAIGGYISKSNAASTESVGSDGVGVVPTIIDSTPYSYTRTVQTEEDVEMMNQTPIWVSVTDIESGLGQRAQVVGESSF